jgi:hypothetical protein
MYMVYIKPRHSHYVNECYAIVNHSVLANKYFTSSKLSLHEKLELASNYLTSISI